MRTALLCATLMLSMAAPAFTASASGFDYATAAREPSPELLTRINRLQESASLRGDFLQRKNLRILKQPFVSRGHFIFSRQNGIYWEIVEPLPDAYLIGKKGMRHAEGGDAALASPFTDGIGRIFSSILGADLEELRSHFDLYYRDSAIWQLGLKPRDRRIAAFISGIEVSGNRYIEAIKIVEAGGDTTEIALTAISEELPAELEARYFNER